MKAAGFRTNAEALEAFRRDAMANYDPAPVAIERGQGAHVWDVEGRRYVDFAAGVAVTSLGHAHAGLTKAISEQAARLLHSSNLYLVPNALRLAHRLKRLTGMDRVFFSNSGTEAIEAALKLARYWGAKNGGRTDFVATEHGFHGRTMGALSVTGQPKYQKGFHPLLPGVQFVPYGDANALAKAIGPTTCGVILEPIQGEGGVHVPPSEYLQRARELCTARGALLILDEVQTGIGRTGSWFAFEQAGVRPDILALAKGLGGGVPIGATLATEAAHAFEPGAHGSTFGGNPLATAAALATLDAVEAEGVLANVRVQGERILKRLKEWERAGLVRGARGRGLLLGFDLPSGASKAFARRLLEAGLLVTNIGEATIRICPPLNVSSAVVEEGLVLLERALHEIPVAPAAPR